ncbi:aromatic compound dioxygenase [Colletotrichum eremochloae]|nr:aromatic compound dioxygenase [Colletotrichum eremochloae]
MADQNGSSTAKGTGRAPAGKAINEAGQMSSNTRNETQPLCGILGLESLVDEITSKQLQLKTASSLEISPTSSAILGPFYHDNSLILSTAAPSLHHLSGRDLEQHGWPVKDATTGIWHTALNGMHEQQHASQPDMDLRGRFRTDGESQYSLHCLKAVPYPILNDVSGGRLLKLLHRHSYRPAHLHLSSPPTGTGPSRRSSLAVKEDLIVEHKPRVSEPKARWTLEYDFALCGA